MFYRIFGRKQWEPGADLPEEEKSTAKGAEHKE
jgi:hypothetical protein